MFTLNNPTAEESVGSFLSTEEDCEYCVFGRETGEAGTPHLQGYICLKEKKSLKWLKTNIHKNCHWEIMRGTPQQASDYCKKDGDFVEIGELPEAPSAAGGAGNKRRWVEVFNNAQAGKFDEIDPQIRIMYHRTLKSIHTDRLLEQPRLDGDLENLWYHGPPGTGKSRKAREDYPDLFLKALNHWWDGYRGEETVLIEEWELTSGKYLGHHLKIWGDRYPFTPEVKGSHLPKQRPKRIIITSNYNIDECFGPSVDLQLNAAIHRRFRQVDFGLL